MAATPDQDSPPVEIELKFDLAAGQLRRLAAHPAMAQPPRVKRLTSVYYDTAGFALRAAGLSLRVRRAGRRYVQTLKRDRGALFERDEWEWPVPTARPDLDLLVDGPAGPILAKADAAPVPVATVRAHRAIRDWRIEGGLVEIAVDRCEVQTGGRSQRFSELELELKDGPPRAAQALAQELFALTPLRLGLLTKGERGYRLAGAALAGFDPALRPTMSCAEGFAAIARACLAQVVEQAACFRASQQAEAIHQTRVGLRRLRTAFRLFAAVVSDGQTGRLNAEARWAASALGDARDLDVFLDDVFDPKALSDPEVARAYGDRLTEARRRAYRQAAKVLAGERFARFTLDLALWIEDGDWRRPADAGRAAWLAEPVGPFAGQALERLRKTVKKRGKALDKLDAESRHELRIRCKRLRYAAEFFAGAFEGSAKRRSAFVAALKQLQDQLGLLNDMAQAQESAVRILGPRAPAALVFAAGELVGRKRTRHGKSLDRARSAYAALMKARGFWPEPVPQTSP